MAEFDKYGRLKNPNFRSCTSFTSEYAYSGGSGSLWNRANGFVVNIGNWLAENFESLADNAALILYFGAWLVFGIGVIATWIGEGFGSALLMAVLGGVAVYYGAAGILKTRYTIPAALIADLAAFLASVLAVHLFFGL